jgi:hypothetical protein
VAGALSAGSRGRQPAGGGELPAVAFDPGLDLSPFALFRALAEGRPPLLIDLRTERCGPTLAGALPEPGEDWRPPTEAEVVLFDADGGGAARAAARRLQAAGCPRVRALFGGLALYDFALDPEVVGGERFLDDS